MCPWPSLCGKLCELDDAPTVLPSSWLLCASSTSTSGGGSIADGGAPPPCALRPYGVLLPSPPPSCVVPPCTNVLDSRMLCSLGGHVSWVVWAGGRLGPALPAEDALGRPEELRVREGGGKL
jgi:hypothetical protein